MQKASSAIAFISLDPDVRSPNDFSIQAYLGLDHRAELIGRGNHGGEPQALELLLDVGRREPRADLGGQLVDYHARSARGRKDAVPRLHVHAAEPALRKRRRLLQSGEPVLTSHGERFQLPALD